MTAKWQYKRAYDAALEHNHELNAENAKLRERIAELEELLPDSGRWFSAETVEAYVAEIAKLRELCAEIISFLDATIPDLVITTEDGKVLMRATFVDRARELGVLV